MNTSRATIRSFRFTPTVLALSVGLLLCVVPQGCDKKKEKAAPAVQEPEKPDPRYKSEEQLRKELEDRRKARDNAPEPTLKPDDPREKLELIWTRGKKRLTTIYHERADLVVALDKRLKAVSKYKENKELTKKLEPLAVALGEFGIGKLPAELEKAPEEICTMIAKVVGPAHEAIDLGEKELGVVNAQIAEMEKLQDTSKAPFQRQWEKVEDAKTRWSGPVFAGRQLLQFVRNLLQEALVLANWGARRTQLSLRKCLTEQSKKGELNYELAEEELQKVLARTKYYRDM